MPIDLSRYPDGWKDIAARIVYGRAGGRCECSGECGAVHRGGRCGAPHGARITRLTADLAQWRNPIEVQKDQRRRYTRPHRVVICAAHLDQNPQHCDPDNLLALCQRCHTLYDRAQHAISRMEAGR